MKDKQQPQAIDLEEMVLGAILMQPKALNKVLDILTPKNFYNAANRFVFDSMVKLSQELKPIDLITVINQLREFNQLDQCGGPIAITKLTNRVTSAENIEFHSRIVLEKFIQREVIRIGQATSELAYESGADPLELLGNLSNELNELSKLTETNVSENFTSHISQLIKDVHEFKDGKALTGIVTPWKKINERFGGWQNSDLIILAARPAMGKTSFALQCASYPVFFEKKRVMMFSLEMGAKQLTARVLSQELEIPANRFTRDASFMDLDDLNSKLGDRQWVYNNNFIIDDRAGLDINQLVSKCKTTNLDNKIDMVVIDYLQLLSDKSVRGNREQEISSISRKLKHLAKDLDVPVIALSQLSRSVESRGGDKIPMLSDLRESGSIEQDADIVMFLHRAEYYGITQDENGESTENKASAITAKYRNGSVGTDELEFNKRFTKFENINNHFTFDNIVPNEAF